jgi:hypothetical protein
MTGLPSNTPSPSLNCNPVTPKDIAFILLTVVPAAAEMSYWMQNYFHEKQRLIQGFSCSPA